MMKAKRRQWVLNTVIVNACISMASAQLHTVPSGETKAVFGGGTRSITLLWHNAGNQAEEANIRAKLIQTSSSTATELAESPWKLLKILPGQTVVETAEIHFPSVKGETRFLIEWLEKTNRIFGVTEVLVFPTNLLRELKLLSGGEALDMFDPGNQLAPSLKASAIDFVTFDDVSLAQFNGKLAIVAASTNTPTKEVMAQVKNAVQKGVAVVWIQPTQSDDKLLPSFFSVVGNQSAVVVVQPELVADFSESPQSQINLIHFCRLALNPRLPTLSDLFPQP